MFGSVEPPAPKEDGGVMAEQTMDCGRPWWRPQSMLFNERRLGSLFA